MSELTKEEVAALVKENEALAKRNEALSKDLEKAKSKKSDEPKSGFKIAKDASVSHMIEVESLSGDKYHENGEKFEVGEKNAIRLAEAKKVKITGKFKNSELEAKAKKLGLLSLILIALLSFGFQANAQTVGKFKATFTDGVTSGLDSAIATNTSPAYLYVTINKIVPETIQVNIVKVSGTVAGTMTLYGCDDTEKWDWVAITDATSTPTITTYTVTDGGTYADPQNKIWNVRNHKFKYYRIGDVGGASQVHYFNAFVFGY